MWILSYGYIICIYNYVYSFYIITYIIIFLLCLGIYRELTCDFDDSTGFVTARVAANPADIYSPIGYLSVDDPQRVTYLLHTWAHRFRILVPFHVYSWVSARDASHLGHCALRHHLSFGLHLDCWWIPARYYHYPGGGARFRSANIRRGAHVYAGITGVDIGDGEDSVALTSGTWQWESTGSRPGDVCTLRWCADQSHGISAGSGPFGRSYSRRYNLGRWLVRVVCKTERSFQRECRNCICGHCLE